MTDLDSGATQRFLPYHISQKKPQSSIHLEIQEIIIIPDVKDDIRI